MEGLTLTRSAEAAGFLAEGKFDLVLLNLHMADPGGIELARQMRSSQWHRRTPIIFISDDQRPSTMSIGFEAGASFFLYKPIDKSRLLNLIRATQGTMEHERRRTRRVPLQSKVHLSWGVEELEGEIVDVSLGGVLVRASHTLPLGSLVRVALNLPQLPEADFGGRISRPAAGWKSDGDSIGPAQRCGQRAATRNSAAHDSERLVRGATGRKKHVPAAIHRMARYLNEL
jgi:CheY-like chemotaxis protein